MLDLSLRWQVIHGDNADYLAHLPKDAAQGNLFAEAK